MFRLRSLELENFGPYKGTQRIEFPRDDGVVMVYGENMRGKTTLLNAIRFVFFGKFVGRGSNDIPLSKVGNWEAAEAGTFGFEVRLDMMYEGVAYRLTRSCTPRPQVSLPKQDDDFVVNYYLEKDGVILGINDAPRELERILPAEISRFFLFDGELLEEYEELLRNESTAGAKIAAAIERVLGMPVLTRSRTTLAATKELAAKEEASAAQGDQKTQQYGVALEQLLAENGVLVSDLTRLENDLVDLRKQKTILEETMRKSERMRTILDRKDFLEKEIINLDSELQIDRSALQLAMSGAWSVVLRDKMKDSLAILRERQRDLQSTVVRQQVLRDLAERHIEICPTCSQGIGDEARAHLTELLARRDDADDNPRAVAELADVARRVGALERHLETGSPAALQVLVANVENTMRSIHTKREEIKELAVQLSGADEDGVRQVRLDYETVIKQIQAVEVGVDATQARIGANGASREGIQNKLARFSGTSVEAARAYFQMNSDLYDLFDEAVGLYRDRLRHRVQEDATKHFVSLTTEEEYVGLRINDSYGLTIVHESGSDIPLRSAGAEHVVALALIAALQNNAPLRGPIVIDSAFVRLDGGHKERIMRTLPTFASQVVVLVYEDEMPPSRARTLLTGNIKAEFKLQRVSARHTKLTELVDA